MGLESQWRINKGVGQSELMSKFRSLELGVSMREENIKRLSLIYRTFLLFTARWMNKKEDKTEHSGQSETASVGQSKILTAEENFPNQEQEQNMTETTGVNPCAIRQSLR